PVRRRWRPVCPSPVATESPPPGTPMYSSDRFAAFAPLAMDGRRPCPALTPCDCFMKYAVVFDEQPMPLIFAALCGGTSSSQNAVISAAVPESCPHPAQSVLIAPS